MGAATPRRSDIVRAIRRSTAARAVRTSPVGDALAESPVWKRIRSWQPEPLEEGNPLEAYFRANPGRRIHKWVHYFDIYHRHLAQYRGKPITVVEFGVSHGGSLQMWKHYFGRKARIIGVDIDPHCSAFAERRVEVVIGDQEDRGFLRQLRDRVGPIDVVIEDGGHTMAQQINTFEVLWPAVRDGGVFLLEDLHTSYWEHYGGGYKRPGTFIEYAKDLIDQINAWHSHG